MTRKTLGLSSVFAALSCAVLVPVLAAGGVGEPTTAEAAPTPADEPGLLGDEPSAEPLFKVEALSTAKDLREKALEILQGIEDDPELLEELRRRYENLRLRLDAPCELGRRIARLPACTTPGECAAYRLWTERMPEGPMAALPDPQRLPGAMPATGPAAPQSEGALPRPTVWPGARPCFASR